MGSETYYCVQCGIRVSGSDVRSDRSHCPRCLPGEPPPPSRDSSKRIRRPSSGALVAVAARPRTTRIDPPRSSRKLLVGGLLSLAGAAVVLAPLLRSPKPSTSIVIVGPAPEARPAPPPINVPAAFIPPPDRIKAAGTFLPVDPAMEALAREIEEAAGILADEGRFEDALARIRAFPAEQRGTRAGAGLEGLKRQIEARARSK
ncbi:MAG TPA: hypothetical protein VF950_12575 [Planctomycetota bacterium]